MPFVNIHVNGAARSDRSGHAESRNGSPHRTLCVETIRLFPKPLFQHGEMAQGSRDSNARSQVD